MSHVAECNDKWVSVSAQTQSSVWSLTQVAENARTAHEVPDFGHGIVDHGPVNARQRLDNAVLVATFMSEIRLGNVRKGKA